MINNSTIHSLGGLNSSLIFNKVEEIGRPIILQFSKQVLHVAFSPYTECHDLVIVVFRKEICIARLRFREEDSSIIDQQVSFKLLQKIETLDNVLSISWSPESSLTTAPYSLVFACNKTDNFGIQVFASNITDEYNDKILLGHSSYVNAIAYEPIGDCLASVSDDLTCRIWEVRDDYDQSTTFYLLSPGVAVCWHKTSPGLMVVGEKNGTLRMYNVRRNVALLSFQSDIGNLTAMTWLPGQTSYLAALCGPNLVVWRTASPSMPQSSTLVHPEGGKHLCFVPGVTVKVFSIGAPENTLKRTIINKASSKVITTFKLVSNISCHSSLPYMAIGVDNTLQLWNTRDI